VQKESEKKAKRRKQKLENFYIQPESDDIDSMMSKQRTYESKKRKIKEKKENEEA